MYESKNKLTDLEVGGVTKPGSSYGLLGGWNWLDFPICPCDDLPQVLGLDMNALIQYKDHMQSLQDLGTSPHLWVNRIELNGPMGASRSRHSPKFPTGGVQ